jgi:hypothetical protein
VGYYKEKVGFCMEAGAMFIATANNSQVTPENAGRSRKLATTYLRMAENCLNMPQARPPAPEPQQAT